MNKFNIVLGIGAVLLVGFMGYMFVDILFIHETVEVSGTVTYCYIERYNGMGTMSTRVYFDSGSRILLIGEHDLMGKKLHIIAKEHREYSLYVIQEIEELS